MWRRSMTPTLPPSPPGSTCWQTAPRRLAQPMTPSPSSSTPRCLRLAGDRCPFELGRLDLAYGERLRRLRAMTEAHVHLAAALDTFDRLGARPWAAQGGQRASSHGPDEAAPDAGPTGVVDPAGARDRRSGRVGAHQQGDRTAPVPVTPDRRRSPLPDISQTGRHLTGWAARRPRLVISRVTR